MNGTAVLIGIGVGALVFLLVNMYLRIESLERRVRKHEDWAYTSSERLLALRDRVDDLQAAVTVLSDAVAPLDDKEQP